MEDEKHQQYIKRIRQIDETLCPAVKSLIELANREGPKDDPLRKNADGPSGGRPVFFPPWVSEHKWPRAGPYLLTRASCCSTLLKIKRIRRRFPSLKEISNVHPEKLIEQTFLPAEGSSLDDYARRLQSQTFGLLNPLTASQVLSVLMDAGERRAHSGIGFLAFFAMTWSLSRGFPVGRGQGAYLGPGNPTAYVTAKCLLPIQKLYRVCRRRAELFSRIKDALKELDGLSKKEANQYSSWEFTATLDELSNLPLKTSELAIDPSALRDCAKKIEGSAGKHGPLINAQYSLNEVTEFLVSTLLAVSGSIKRVAAEAQRVVDWVGERIVEKLKSQPQWDGKLTDDLSLELGQEWHGKDAYWNDLREAAQTAHGICVKALDTLRESSGSCEAALADRTVQSVSNALTLLAEANENLADLFGVEFSDHARWCRTVVDREIAHISAENYTDFDPAGLVSGIAVAVRWGEMSSSLEVRDAVGKALEGARMDGSWKPGQPFYTAARGLAVVPVTSDIVWTLATAVAQYPEIAHADSIFEQYVDWLGRTQTEVKALIPPIDPNDKPKPVALAGWPSERAREPRSVDLWATALAINALLEIRGLFEYRLWQICEERFTVLQPRKLFHKLDPVDLGANHARRIQRKLVEFSRRARDANKDAEYALVLHGPPGSSKTSLAEALATEMWSASTGESRLIRITPADFTRLGEERLDYEARVIFELLQSVRGVTVLFDEIDDLLRRRQPGEDPTFIKLVVPAMLNRLQDLRDASPSQELCILFATNYIEQIEPALLRRGRIDQCIPVVYPDPDSRHAIVCRHIGEADHGGAKVLAEHRDLVVRGTSGWPWKTLDELCGRVADRARQGEFRASDSTTKEKIEILISEFQASLTDPTYQERLNDSRLRSSQLRHEVLHHCFAYGSWPQEYKRMLETLNRDLVQDGVRVWDALGRQKERRLTARP